MRKIHIGCGPTLLDGWHNVDMEGEHIDEKFDIVKPWPIQDSSVNFIYSEHVFEHLTPDEALLSLRECYRVMEKGGVIRTAMPDLDYLCGKYFEDWTQQDWIQNRGFSHIKTKAEMLNTCFYFWGHRWIYNFEEFARRLKCAGFHNPERKQFGISAFESLKNLETRLDSKLIVEVSKD